MYDIWYEFYHKQYIINISNNILALTNWLNIINIYFTGKTGGKSGGKSGKQHQHYDEDIGKYYLLLKE